MLVHLNYIADVFVPGSTHWLSILICSCVKHVSGSVPPQTLLFLSQINDLQSECVPFSSPLNAVSPFLVV